MPTFVLDANCFIQAHRERYPIDVAPSFWKKIKELADREIIVSIDKVRAELFENNDELTGWIDNNLDDTFFHDTQDDQVLLKYQNLVNWVQGKSDQYLLRAIEDFMEYDNADAWLVAFVKVFDLTLVTYEVSAPNSKNIIKIPDVCNEFEVQCIDPIKMFRDLGETF